MFQRIRYWCKRKQESRGDESRKDNLELEVIHPEAMKERRKSCIYGRLRAATALILTPLTRT